MAHVRMPDGREFDIDDRPELEAYYIGEGATVTKTLEASGVSFPRVFDGERYLDEEEQTAEPTAEPAEVETGGETGGDLLNLSGEGTDDGAGVLQVSGETGDASSEQH